MNDIKDDFRVLRDYRRKSRDQNGVECQGCIRSHPTRDPTILFPGQKCGWCGNKDPRHEVSHDH